MRYKSLSKTVFYYNRNKAECDNHHQTVILFLISICRRVEFFEKYLFFWSSGKIVASTYMYCISRNVRESGICVLS